MGVVEENPDFHLWVEEECGVVMSVIADQTNQLKLKLGRRGPISFNNGVKHLQNNTYVSQIYYEIPTSL